MSKLIIFDADSIVFTVAWKFRTKKTTNLVRINTNKFITDVLTMSGADDYIGFYADRASDSKPNFRYDVASDYKANRPDTPDFVVKWGETITNEFRDTWGFIPVQGMEADDAVAMTAEKYKNDYNEIIVATFDKDLKQIPNTTWYNMKNHKSEVISKFNAAKHFYIQQLMGDTTDNITGLYGVGIKTAEKLLKPCGTEYSLFRRTVIEYINTRKKLEEKELATITADVKQKLQDLDQDTLDIYAKLSDAHFNRKVRINSKDQVDEMLDGIFPGGWKEYYKQQNKLLKLLTVAPDDFIIPEVQESPVRSLIDDVKIDTVIKQSDLDDFLTV